MLNFWWSFECFNDSIIAFPNIKSQIIEKERKNWLIKTIQQYSCLLRIPIKVNPKMLLSNLTRSYSNFSIFCLFCAMICKKLVINAINMLINISHQSKGNFFKDVKWEGNLIKFILKAALKWAYWSHRNSTQNDLIRFCRPRVKPFTCYFYHILYVHSYKVNFFDFYRHSKCHPFVLLLNCRRLQLINLGMLTRLSSKKQVKVLIEQVYLGNPINNNVSFFKGWFF